MHHHLGTYAGHAAASGFLSHIISMIIHAAIFSIIYRLIAHIPWYFLVAILGVGIYAGYKYAKKTGYRID